MSKNKKIIIALAILIIAVIGFALVWHFCGVQNDTQEGSKTLTLTVTHFDGSARDFSIKTDAEYLRGALDELGIVKGDESEFGLFITEVDGEAAESLIEQWWGVYKDTELLSVGVESQPIADGEHYELKLMTGYDF